MQASERRKRKTQAKREAILRSAARAFSSHGYYGTSMEEIADQLYMTKGSLYYYFKDKEELLFACHDYSLNLVLENLKRVKKLDLPCDQALGLLIASHIEAILDVLQGSSMALDFTALSGDLLQRVIAKRDRFEQGFRQLIEEGIREKKFRAVDAKLSAFMILGSVNWIARWYRHTGSYHASMIARHYADLFIGGLKTGSGIALEALCAEYQSPIKTEVQEQRQKITS